MSSDLYNIIVHYKEQSNTIINADPDTYSYIELVNDLCEFYQCLLPSAKAWTITFSASIPGSSDRHVIKSDVDVLTMFDKCAKDNIVDMFIERRN